MRARWPVFALFSMLMTSLPAAQQPPAAGTAVQGQGQGQGRGGGRGQQTPEQREAAARAAYEREAALPKLPSIVRHPAMRAATRGSTGVVAR